MQPTLRSISSSESDNRGSSYRTMLLSSKSSCPNEGSEISLCVGTMPSVSRAVGVGFSPIVRSPNLMCCEISTKNAVVHNWARVLLSLIQKHDQDTDRLGRIILEQVQSLF